MYRNPYQELSAGKWYKVNFHTHAGTEPDSCGENPIDRIVALYARNKFDMLCISNHDLFTDASSFTTESMLMIPGVEYSAYPHMLTIGVDRSLRELEHQQAIDQTNAQGGFAILCHPNWKKKEYWQWESALALKGYVGIEIMNMLIYRLSGSGLATDLWDYLLSQGRLVFGFGSDDFHILSDAGRSYNYIYCHERSYAGVKDAVTKGAVCASTGLMPVYLTLDDHFVRAKATYPTETYVDTFTYRFISENGKVLSIQHGSEAEYHLNGVKYVRVEVSGENGAMLFFQPVYDEEVMRPCDD